MGNKTGGIENDKDIQKYEGKNMQDQYNERTDRID